VPNRDGLPRSTPAEQGVDAAGIDAFLAALAPLAEVETHSLMVVRHGHVVAEAWFEPYSPSAPHLLYSLSKSFTSTALGFAVDEGLVDLDATVLSYFPEFDGRVTDPRSRAIKVRHVAAMASGHDDDIIDEAIAAGDGDMLLGLLLIPPDREPGSVFAYNQPCTYALSAIVQRVSGGSLTEFLRPRLFEPLGITAYGWRTDGRGREIGYAGLHVPTEAIAKVGLLYLNDGEWAGRRLLSAAWIAEATRSHIVPDREQIDWRQGYGFQFWHSRHGYRGDGAYGQFMLILPEADAVVAMTAQSPDMQAVLDAAWTHLLPALTAESGPAGPWTPATSTLARPGPPGEISTGTFTAGEGNEVATVREVRVGAGAVVLRDGGADLVVRLGAPGEGWTSTGPVATAYARTEVDLVFTETPHRLRVTLDPATAHFAARWVTTPIGELPLSETRMPAAG
jgi:CubicO group peptidase (beta-lactamase class C family)